jgi:hypothetical protein
MESIQVAMLTLTAIAVGVLCTVMVQLHLALRQLRADVAATRARVEPLLDRFNQSSQIASALGVAIAAGAKAFRESQRAAAAQPATEGSHE